MPTVDTRGNLHDAHSGEFTNKARSAAAYDLGDLFTDFDHLVTQARHDGADQAAREAYPDLFAGHTSLIEDGAYVGALDPARRAYIGAAGMNPEPITWPDDAADTEFTPGYGVWAGQWQVVSGSSAGRGATPDEAWQAFLTDAVGARMEGGESDADVADWIREANAREDRIDEVVAERGGVRLNALYRAGEEPCDTTTTVTLCVDGQSELCAVHTLGSDGDRITTDDLASNPDYYRGVVAGVAAAYGPAAGKAVVDSIRTGRLSGTFTHRASAADVRRATVEHLPVNLLAGDDEDRADALEHNKEYLRGAHQAMTCTHAYWQLGLEDEEGVVDPG